MTKIRIAGMAVILAGVVAILGYPTSAHAASITDRWVDNETNLCLDSNYNGNVYTQPCNGGNYQNWYETLSSAAILHNNQTGRCLDSNYNGNVYTLPCNGGKYQEWVITYHPSVQAYTVKDYQTGRCLDSNYNGNVYTLPCNGGNYQYWYVA
jgi:hypothetical protein